MSERRRSSIALCAAALASPALALGPHEQIPGPHVDRAVPDYDFQWAVVGDVGNANWRYTERSEERGSSNNDGYGRVNYKYRISRHEVTTVQWMEFVNTIAPLTDSPSTFARPFSWGAVPVGAGQYELASFLPDAAMTPLMGITWREAAMFCNWLHNGKEASLEAIADGAYDTSTFGEIPPPHPPDVSVTDQSVRSPGAQFWIPSESEWMKAAHWDPDRYGQDQGGWWDYPNSSDTMPVPGLPGEGESAAGLQFDPGLWALPLGAYADVQSPWGLWDASGGALEWTELWAPAGGMIERGWESSYNGGGNGGVTDHVGYAAGSHGPDEFSFTSVRIASIVPAPGGVVLGAAGALMALRRRRDGRRSPAP